MTNEKLKHYEILRDKAVELIHIHKVLDAELGQDKDVRFILYEEKIVLEFHDIKVLSKLRKAIKSIYPKWQDKINSVWESADPNNMLTSWQSKQYPLVCFWLECRITEYPGSLIKPGCKIVTATEKVTRSSMVCEN